MQFKAYISYLFLLLIPPKRNGLRQKKKLYYFLILCILWTILLVWAKSCHLSGHMVIGLVSLACSLSQVRSWHDVTLDHSNDLPMCLSLSSKLSWAHFHGHGYRVQRESKSQCRSTFKFYFCYFFLMTSWTKQVTWPSPDLESRKTHKLHH